MHYISISLEYRCNASFKFLYTLHKILYIYIQCLFKNNDLDLYACLKQLKQALDIVTKNSLNINLYVTIYKYQSVKYFILKRQLRLKFTLFKIDVYVDYVYVCVYVCAHMYV